MTATTATSGGDDGDLTVGEVVDYLRQVRVPVSIGGFVMQYRATIDISEGMDNWRVVDENL